MKYRQADDTKREILDCTLELGRRMVQAGAEVHRVENTIHRILTAYHAVSTEVFSISSMVLCTVRYEDGTILTQSKRIIGYGINLRKLELYNSLSRQICSECPPPAEFRKGLRRIALSRTKTWFDALCYMLSAASMALLFGGSLLDGLASACLGIIVFLFDRKIKTPDSNVIVYTLFSCLITGLCAILFVRFGFGTHLDKILISVVFLFIPTLAFCNAVKDMLTGDILTGWYRFLEAVLIAAAMTAGFFIASILTHTPSSYVPRIPYNITPWYEQLMLIFIGTFGFSVYFRIEHKRAWQAAVGGVISWIVFLVSMHFWNNILIADACAAIIIEFYAEIAARIWKAPANIFLLPGIIPLVPGASLYRCINTLFEENLQHFLSASGSLVRETIGIEIGLLLSYIVYWRLMNTIRKIRQKSI